jgi:hypothetical protein
MTKQDQAFKAFMAYMRKAGIGHIIGIMRLRDAIRTKYQKDIYLRDPISIEELNDEDAGIVISVIDSLEVSSPSAIIQKEVGL